MLLTYNAPGGKEVWAAMSEAEREAEEGEYRDLIQSMREKGIFLAAEEVEHYDAARTVRIRDGSLSVSELGCPRLQGELSITLSPGSSTM